jgi:hypothetical protein
MSTCCHVVGGVGKLFEHDLRQLLQNPSCDVCRYDISLSLSGPCSSFQIIFVTDLFKIFFAKKALFYVKFLTIKN